LEFFALAFLFDGELQRLFCNSFSYSLHQKILIVCFSAKVKFDSSNSSRDIKEKHCGATLSTNHHRNASGGISVMNRTSPGKLARRVGCSTEAGEGSSSTIWSANQPSS
jgi:hypothetical protein